MADQITTSTSLRWSQEEQAEHRRQWVAALRSGEFKRGKTALRQKAEDGEETYCCLGVACELAVRDGVIPPAQDNGTYLYRYVTSTGYLPEEVRDWLGLDSTAGDLQFPVSRHAGVYNLALANDEYGWDFERIADAIENDEVKLR